MALPTAQKLAGPWVRPELLGSLPEPAGNLLWILTLTGQPCSTAELVHLTCRSHRDVRHSLSKLAAEQLVFKISPDQWMLASDFREQVAAICRHSFDIFYDDYANDYISELEQLLHHIGISPPAFDRLSARRDLQAEPAIVQAWWWYYLTMDWPTNRAGLVIKRLDKEEWPPQEFLRLARAWPKVTAADKAELEQMLWRGYSPNQLSHAFSERYPQLSAEAFVAFQVLYAAFPQALGY